MASEVLGLRASVPLPNTNKKSSGELSRCNSYAEDKENSTLSACGKRTIQPQQGCSVEFSEVQRHIQCGLCNSLLASSLVLSCGHIFCGDCLFEHLNNKPSCPTCTVSLRAIPVRCVALDAVVTAFSKALPKAEAAALAQRVEDGKAAANKLNKMFWWLQPAAVPVAAPGAEGGVLGPMQSANASAPGGGAPRHPRSHHATPRTSFSGNSSSGQQPLSRTSLNGGCNPGANFAAAPAPAYGAGYQAPAVHQAPMCSYGLGPVGSQVQMAPGLMGNLSYSGLAPQPQLPMQQTCTQGLNPYLMQDMAAANQAASAMNNLHTQAQLQQLLQQLYLA